MIETYKHKGLKELFQKGATGKIDSRWHARLREVLDVINRAQNVQDVNLPGYFLHPLKQYNPWRWSVWISGQWRITFEFNKGDAYRVDFEQYH